MSNHGLSDLDAIIHSAMSAAGIADHAEYRASPSGPAVPCRVFVNRAMQQMGDFGQVSGARVLVEILRADVADPVRGAIVTLVDPATGLPTGEAFKLESLEAGTDESMSRWVVGNGQ